MEVDLGQDVVQDQVVELLFVGEVGGEGAGDDAQAGGQAAHGQGMNAVVGDDRAKAIARRSPPSNRTGFRRETTTTAHRPGWRPSNGSSLRDWPAR
ncbi:MAG TPA: hypothetical protein VF468_27940 [Actinomycetota bacterium]|nr:hypothetical protein [Actinomycetota bacterium]